jgi:hypothetical protein
VPWIEAKMADLMFQQVDVFSTEPFKGNPVAVVAGADALSDRRLIGTATAGEPGHRPLAYVSVPPAGWSDRSRGTSGWTSFDAAP